MADTDNITEARHPEYTEKVLQWDKYKLAYLANDEYYTTTVDKFSSKEPEKQYNTRVKRAYNALPCKGYISKLQNMTFRKRFDYKYKASDTEIDQLVQTNVDGKGTSLFNFHVGTVLKWLATYGEYYIYTAMPSFEGELTREQQQQAGIFPYLVGVHPQNVVAWRYKEGSQSEFAQLLMKTTDQKIDKFGFTQFDTVFMLYTEDMIYKYDTQGEILEEYTNTIGKVAFSKISIGESFLSDIVRIAAAAVNLASGNLNFLEKSNFPILGQKGQEKLETFDAGAGWGVFLGENGELKYVEYPTGSLDFNAKTMDKLKELADEAASQKYQSIATHVRQSGESQKENFKDVDAALSWINSIISEGLQQAIGYMGDYLSKSNVKLTHNAPITYLNESPSDVVKRSQQMLDIAEDAKSNEMRAAISEQAYNPLLAGVKDKEKVLKAEEKAILADKGMEEAMRSAMTDSQTITVQGVPSQPGSAGVPDEG